MAKPLVSVVVVTFNSSKTVVETLESVKNQTYSNMELIVTDDSSVDSTVDICKHWLNMNKEAFQGVKIIESKKNTGITANRNRGNYAASGEWIKHVDGDDKLLPTCISDYVEFVTNNSDANIIFSPLKVFGEGDLEKWTLLLKTNFKFVFSLSSRDLKVLLCKTNLFPAPSLFVQADFFRKVGGYDEEIRDLEDWPFWVKAAFHDAQFAYIDDPTVEYRISATSLSQGVGGINPRYRNAMKQIEKKNLEYMKRISWLYFLEGFLAYKKKYANDRCWSLLSYLRPINPYFWKVRKLYFSYISYK